MVSKESKFKVGDIVVRAGVDWMGVKKGGVYEVVDILPMNCIQLKGMQGAGWDAFMFDLYQESKQVAPVPTPPSDPLKTQISGDHYKSLPIQPIEYIHANGIPFAEGCVIKYVSRWKSKGGIRDLEKARHFIDLLIALEQKASK